MSTRLSDDGATAVLCHMRQLRQLRREACHAAIFAANGDAAGAREHRINADAIQAELIADYGERIRAAEEVTT